MKKWNIKKLQIASPKLQVQDIVNILLENRGLKTKKEIEEFLHPKLESVTAKSVGINQIQLKKALKRIQNAIDKKEQIVVFGDYDVDGICGSAILWETLNALGAKVLPYIPHRIDEGYGLSIRGISNLKSQISNLKDTSLIITVDNGIVANEAVEYANKEGIDVIIADHHVPSKKLPDAHAIVHTTKLCGTGVAWLMANSLWQIEDSPKTISYKQLAIGHLELVALATVADLVPLKGANRTLLVYGLEQLRNTKRVGLIELFKEAVLDKGSIGVYEIGHIIAPRLNASGRLESAMDSLRLLCTTDKKRAENLAFQLGSVNRERQQITIETALDAIGRFKIYDLRFKKILFVADQKYQAGVIGLVAGRLVEEFYRPAIVLSVGETHAKASARSIHGFNIIEFIRTASHLLVDAGGHPMAAGFTVQIEKIEELQKHFEEHAGELLTEDMFQRTLPVDCEIPLSFVSEELYSALQKLSPFGMGNPEPTFVSRGVSVQEARSVGQNGKHLKLGFKTTDLRFKIEGIGFGLGERISEIKPESIVDIVYTISQDTWNGNKKLQLKIKDFLMSSPK